MLKTISIDRVNGEDIKFAEFQFKSIDFYVLKVGDEFHHEGSTWVKIDDDTAENIKNNEIRHFWPLFPAKLSQSITETEAVKKWPILAYSL